MPSVMSAQSRLPKIGEVTKVALPVTHCRPGIDGVAEGRLTTTATVR